MDTKASHPVTQFATEAAALRIASGCGGPAEGYVVARSINLAGKYVIKIIDTASGTHVSHL